MMKDRGKYNDFRIPVPKNYEEVFSHFYHAENRSEDAITRTLLPSYQTILVFSFGTEVWLQTRQKSKIFLDKCLILGPIKQAFDYSLPENSEILVANFKDDAFYRFFGTASVAENLPLHPDDLVDENCFTALWHELNTLTNTSDRIHYILNFCKPYLKQRDGIAEQLLNFKDQNLNPIKSIAHELKQTERNIQINHKKRLGFSAKELNRYQRFLKALLRIRETASGGSKIDWFEIVNECGYYDQSQLIHDFKHYLNLSPANYLKFQQDICNPIA